MKKLRCALVSLVLIAAMLASGSSLLAFAADDPWVLIGDINQDGFVTVTDARQALRQAGRLDKALEPKSLNFIAADIDKDGRISAVDARTILRHTASLEIIDQPKNPYAVEGKTNQNILDMIRDHGNAVKREQMSFQREIRGEDDVNINYKLKVLANLFMTPEEKAALAQEFKAMENSMSQPPYTHGPYFYHGSRADEIFPSEGREVSITDDFNVGMLRGATAVASADGKQQTYTIMLKNESYNNIHDKNVSSGIRTNHGKVFADQNLSEMSVAFDLIEEFAGEQGVNVNSSMSFRDSYVEYTFEGDTLIKAVYHLEVGINIKIEVPLTFEFSINALSSTTHVFTDFVKTEVETTDTV